MQPIQINVSVNIGVNQELYGLLSSLLSRPQEVVETAAPAPRKPRAAKQQPVVENEEPEQTAKEYTEVDVRAAMDATRRRIEGEDYKNNTGSEGYKRWHRALTAWFKNTATMLGAEKPSALPDSESRGSFIARCDAVYVKDDELVEDCSF